MLYGYMKSSGGSATQSTDSTPVVVSGGSSNTNATTSDTSTDTNTSTKDSVIRFVQHQVLGTVQTVQGAYQKLTSNGMSMESTDSGSGGGSVGTSFMGFKFGGSASSSHDRSDSSASQNATASANSYNLTSGINGDYETDIELTNPTSDQLETVFEYAERMGGSAAQKLNQQTTTYDQQTSALQNQLDSATGVTAIRELARLQNGQS
jgi:hypothetical protein